MASSMAGAVGLSPPPEMRLWRLDRIVSADLLDRAFQQRADRNSLGHRASWNTPKDCAAYSAKLKSSRRCVRFVRGVRCASHCSGGSLSAVVGGGDGHQASLGNDQG